MAGQVLYPVSTYPSGSPFKQSGDISGGGGSNGGLGNLLAALAPPRDKSTTKFPLEPDAQGNDTFDVTPASMGGGFLNRLVAGKQGAMQVNQINAALQQARLEAMSRQAAIREEGKQSRMGHITDAQISMLQGMGLMPRTTPDGSAINADLINAVAAKTEQPKLDIAGSTASAQADATQSPPKAAKAIGESTIGNLMGASFCSTKGFSSECHTRRYCSI